MKTGYLITARLKSTRLKRKILLDIDGETVLDKVIKRCKAVNGVDEVILCTSTNEEDAELKHYAEKHNIAFFRGDENDVLKRLLDAAQTEGIDRFLSITADNPLHSIILANRVLEFDNRNKCDFIFTQNVPVGIAPYFINVNALDVTVYMKKESDTEIWGPFVKQPDFFRIGYLNIDNLTIPASQRITCDYETDYEMIKDIYSKISSNLPDLPELIELHNKNKELFIVNHGIIQRQLDSALVNKIRNDFTNQRENGEHYTAKMGYTFSPSEIVEHFSIT